MKKAKQKTGKRVRVTVEFRGAQAEHILEAGKRLGETPEGVVELLSVQAARAVLAGGDRLSIAASPESDMVLFALDTETIRTINKIEHKSRIDSGKLMAQGVRVLAEALDSGLETATVTDEQVALAFGAKPRQDSPGCAQVVTTLQRSNIEGLRILGESGVEPHWLIDMAVAAYLRGVLDPSILSFRGMRERFNTPGKINAILRKHEIGPSYAA